MRKFIRKIITILFLLILFTELFSRLFIDPFYFYSIDTYDLDLESPSIVEVLRSEKAEHVDYLFLGSSRVPATINASVIMDHTNDKVAVVAGRGYMTSGIHYQAIKNKILEYPAFLEGSKVFLEYPGSTVYSTPFKNDRLRVYEPLLNEDKAMPHLLLPHLNFKSLITFIRESSNSNSVKLHLTLQYCSSSYRTISYIKENFIKLDQVLLFNKETNQQLANDGGIRNDHIDLAIQKAEEYKDIQIKRIEESQLLTFQDLEESTLSYIHELVVKNGGEFFLFKMPLSSKQAEIYQIGKSLQNRKIFEEWLEHKGIKVFQIENFNYQDRDFPDTWHLSLDRRDEFTSMLFDEVLSYEPL